jgi:opacity protein-like surface antigen
LQELGALSFAGAALAADLPMKAPFVSAPVFSWTGGYVGGHVGAGSGGLGLSIARSLPAHRRAVEQPQA